MLRVQKGSVSTRDVVLGVQDTTVTMAMTTAVATHDVEFTQPAGTILRNLLAYPAALFETGALAGDNILFRLGTGSAGEQIIADTAILNNGGGTVSWLAGSPLYLIKDSAGHDANAFVSTSTAAGVVGGPATSAAVTIDTSTGNLYCPATADRKLYIRISVVQNILAAASGHLKFTAQFLHL